MRKGAKAAIAAGVAVILVVGGVLVVRERAARELAQDRRDALATAQQFLRAWTDKQYPRMTELTAGATDDPGSAYQRTDERLKVTAAQALPGPLSPDGRTVPFTARLQLGGLGELAYATDLHLVERGDRWLVDFRPQTLHPALAVGEQLQLRTREGIRAELADRSGRPIRAASADLAANVLGRPATAGTPASGLERVLNAELAGAAGGAVVVGTTGGQELRVLQEFPGRPGEPVRTTLDLDVQAAAEAALAGAPGPRSALVAVDTATGEVRAVANRPVAGTVGAFESYAPGSVFKVVTATALLQAGLTPSSPAPCPDTTSSGQRQFRNDPGVVPGDKSLAEAMAVSCNTALLELAEQLPSGALQAAAELYGFGLPELLPIRVEGGRFPPPTSPAAAAEAVIGQGAVEASPLMLAAMVAAVADGTWRQPRLLPGQGEDRPLPAGVVAPLQSMLRDVVTSGSGTLAQGPGGPVSGKTGTAQFGVDAPPKTHAWFAGWRGGLAFCVFVEEGSGGGAVAAPIAQRFLAQLSG